MARKETIKKWHNYFTRSLERGLTWNRIRLDLILKHKYKASLIEKLIYNYRLERAIKQKKKHRLAVGLAASLLIIMFMLPFILKPSILGMVLGGPPVTYYVDATNGLDSNDGLTEATPIRTLAKASSLKLYPGDSVLFKRGEIWREHFKYSGNSGTSDAKITFGAYGTGDKPKFYGSINATSPSYWTSLGNNRWSTPADFPSEVYMIFYNTKEDAQMGARRLYDSALTSNWDFMWSNGKIIVYNTDNPGAAGNGIELPKYNTTSQFIVFLSSVDYIMFKDIEISYARYRGLDDYRGEHNEFRNLDFKYIYEKALWLEGNDVIADNNSFYLCGIRGQPVPYGLDAQGENMWITQIDNPMITNNKVERCGGVCINLYHTNGGEVKGNRVFNCQQSPTDWSAAIYYDGCSNSVASYNNVSDCQIGLQVGAEVDGTQSQNITFHHNIAYNNAVSGIVIDSTQKSIVNNNINIHHNIFFRDVYVLGSGFGNDIFLKYFNNLVFKDNIIYNTYQDSSRGRMLYLFNGSSGVGFSSDYNSWKSAIGRNIWQLNGVKDYTSLTAWQSGQKQDSNSINDDPLFMDAEDWDFRLQANSMACIASSTGSYVGALPCEGEPAPPEPFCGDNACNGLENCSTCPADCGACPVPEPFCGDLTCDANENCTTCETDCGICPEEQEPTQLCGDASCNGLENCSSCASDCGSCPIVPFCGDGACNGLESCLSCPADCGDCPAVPSCGDSSCNGVENCSTCPGDCGSCPIIYYCGDHSCNNNENCSTCEADCNACPVPEPFCGDSNCSENENCSTCSIDCGNCPEIPVLFCGDSNCNYPENCSTCAPDCGACIESSPVTTVKRPSKGGGGGGGGGSSGGTSTLMPQTSTAKNTSSTNLIGQAVSWVKETVKEAEQKVNQEFGEEEAQPPQEIITEPGQETPGEVELGTNEPNHALLTSIAIMVFIVLIGVVTTAKTHYPKLKAALLNKKIGTKQAVKEPKAQESLEKPKDLSISALKNNTIEELVKLHKYVSEAANRGYSRERVNNELLGVGWDKHLVGVLLSMHDSEFIPEEVPEPPLSQFTANTQAQAQTVSRNTSTVNPNIDNSIIKWTEFEDIR